MVQLLLAALDLSKLVAPLPPIELMFAIQSRVSRTVYGYNWPKMSPVCQGWPLVSKCNVLQDQLLLTDLTRTPFLNP